MVISYKVNVAEIATYMRPAVEQWMNASIRIIDPNTTSGTFDRFQNSTTGGGTTDIYTGIARIQPIRGANEADSGLQSTELRGIEFQIPFTTVPIPAGYRILVTDGGEDVTLENYIYTIESGINSSGMWTRTVFARVDLKAIQ